MEIKKVYKESLPEVKLIGKRYKDADRDQYGTFATQWQEWFKEEHFDMLQEHCISLEGISNGYLGAMRMSSDNGMEYWIGAFYAPESLVPEGFEAIDIAAEELGVAWLYGNGENGELYTEEAFKLAFDALTEKGWHFSEQGWFLERYNCPRFTSPDDKGNVILDICAYLIAE